MKTVALIPARGGSKGIPKKNIKIFCGKPLIYWTLKAANECTLIDEIYVSTDDENIKTIVNSFNMDKVQVISRSEYTATDNASTESVIEDFTKKINYKHIVLIQATSPLLESTDLENGIRKYNSEKYDSLLSVVRQKRFIWEQSGDVAKPINYKPENRPRRQEMNGYLVENGAFYITSHKAYAESQTRISGKTGTYEMPEDSYFEIDEIHDWEIAEQLKLNRNNNNSFKKLKNIKLLICDVDGVLTDAGMYYTCSGDELKKFNARDGKGIELLKQCGVKVMLLTSEDNSIIQKRAAKIKADYTFMGVKDKRALLDKFFAENIELSYNTTVYIGDDINDKEAMQQVVFSATPKNSHKSIQQIANYISSYNGGEGCVREICDLIIKYIASR